MWGIKHWGVEHPVLEAGFCKSIVGGWMLECQAAHFGRRRIVHRMYMCMCVWHVRMAAGRSHTWLGAPELCAPPLSPPPSAAAAAAAAAIAAAAAAVAAAALSLTGSQR